ncbi:MAG: hypothetical protein RML93_07535 [Anaerolineales bacterium]|nr:hypothetical protein [Anaerolineales bacterium]MCS7248908.1 hypothetical protein [Anaerolineales bacterium]MDW8162721.1 hypothetical protein [Anaerolineales bacterium]MDW8447125.1 hypothetical protein [Anaerolineales bacterium]
MNSITAFEWDWRKEVFLLAHRWYLWLALFLLGCGVGWLMAGLLPTPYRAEADLGVFYQSDAIFRNVDDYKNWEMGQLQALILSDQLLTLVRQRLSEQDPFWQTQTPADLRQRLHVYWRNAGVWHLVAEDRQPQRAEQLVRAWKAVILEEMARIAQLTHQLKQIHAELQALGQAKVATEQRLVELQAMATLLQNWQPWKDANLAQEPIPPLQRWRLLELALRLDEHPQSETSLAASMPPPAAAATQYQPWAERALAAIEMQSQLLREQQPFLEQRLSETTTKYNEVAAASWYLSVYLGVDELSAEIRAPRPVRTQALAALVGGLLALLFGLAISLAALQWRREKLGTQ